MKRISSKFNSMAHKFNPIHQSDGSSSSSRERRKTSAPESMRQALPKRAITIREATSDDSWLSSPENSAPSSPTAVSSPPADFFHNLNQWIPENAPAVNWEARHGSTQSSSAHEQWAPPSADFFHNLSPWVPDNAPPVHGYGASQPPAYSPPAHEQPASPAADFFSNLSPFIPENATPFDWEAYARKQGRN
ncbi:hypothetical protein [Ralstonia solanacearum]|uniref:hypothetical protein n=1 Tax=Ralstonia solanacearum TaxID=305 RepID=UPI0018D06CF5|nr:hypothetical protein [Ralstonia solanacearum]